jgi:hypothetical protein
MNKLDPPLCSSCLKSGVARSAGGVAMRSNFSQCNFPKSAKNANHFIICPIGPNIKSALFTISFYIRGICAKSSLKKYE